MPKRKRMPNQNREEVKSREVVKDPADMMTRSIFILENASLNKGFVQKKTRILNRAEHTQFLLRQGKNPNDYRPDIVFGALKGILDSRLNRFGMVGAVYVKTDSGLLFEIKPHVRIPRSYKRFSGLILELFEKSCIRAPDTGDVLMRLLDGPVSRYLPDNSRVIGLSYNSQKLVNVNDYVSAFTDDFNPVFVVGAMVHGQVTKDCADDFISVSNYRLGARCCLNIISRAMEQKWKLH